MNSNQNYDFIRDMVWKKREEMVKELEDDDDSPLFGTYIPHPFGGKGGLGVICVETNFIIQRKHADAMTTVIVEALKGFDMDPVYIGEGKKSTLIFTAEKREHIKPFLERIQARLITKSWDTPASLKRWKRKREKGKLCVRCLKVSKNKCSCLKERYCSKECQKEDWACHKLIHNKD